MVDDTYAGSAVLGLGEIRHLGCVVHDLDSAIARRQRLDPTVEWRGWTYGPDYLHWQELRGTPSEFSARIAVSSGAHQQLELIQPLFGDTSWARALELGEGTLHHVGFLVHDFWAELSRLEGMGFEVLDAAGGHGLDGDGALAYLDTRPAIGVYAEIIKPPHRRADPHFTVAAARSREAEAG